MKSLITAIVPTVFVVLVGGCTPACAQDGGFESRDPRANGYAPTDVAQASDDPYADVVYEPHCRCQCRHDRRGWLVGFSFGAGGGKLNFERGERDHDADAETGFLGALRFGYGVSNSLAFAVEAQGFNRSANGSEWNAGALLGSLTWWPDGGGFFLRLGIGGGGIDLVEPHADGTERTLEHEGSAAGMALGYEWRVGRTFALGLTADLVGLDIDDTEVLRDLAFGYAGFSVQFHWYL